MKRRNKFSPGKMLGFLAKILIVAMVLLFLGMQSINFFSFTFPPEQWYYAYLGFGLTSGGVIAYMIVLKKDADTQMKRLIAVIMMAVCVIGELVTAGFGMQIEAWKQAGMQMTSDDFHFMVIAIQILGLIHGLALLFYFAGDQIIELFMDEDEDGVPNLFDPDYHMPKSSVSNVYNQNEVDPTRRQ